MFRRAALLESGGPSPHAVVVDDRRIQARFGLAHYAGDSVLPIRAPGSKRSPARGNHRQARGDLLETAGASRVLSLDLHAPQIQGYFNIPVDHLYAAPVLVEYFKKKNLGPITVVSPDAGGVERAGFSRSASMRRWRSWTSAASTST